MIQATFLSTEPQVAVSIFDDCINNFIIQKAAIIALGLIMRETADIGVDEIQPITRSHPKITFRIFENTLDGIMAQTVGIIGIMLKVIKPVRRRIKLINPAAIAHP
jgi:hypothetical protein